jgi:hypothetical protein
MLDPHAQRTLVKSPPELWAEISDVAALAGHLGEFGEIRITRLEPETTVAWEGDRARGTVRLEPSGWGTKVTLTAALSEQPEAPAPAEPPPPAAEAQTPPPPQQEPEPEAAAVAPEEEQHPEPEAPRPRLFARLFRRRRRTRPIEDGPAAEPPPATEPLEDGPGAEPPSATAPATAEPEPEPTPVAPEPALDGERATAILTAVLDDLGSARHRPFSRS